MLACLLVAAQLVENPREGVEVGRVTLLEIDSLGRHLHRLLEKGNSTYLDTFAWILYKLGRYEQARKHMRQALSLDRTESAELPLHYGDILFALNERFMAETYWKKALGMGADKEAIELRLAIPKQAKDKRVEEFLVVDKKKKK